MPVGTLMPGRVKTRRSVAVYSPYRFYTMRPVEWKTESSEFGFY
jgi:hypothetical protein